MSRSAFLTEQLRAYVPSGATESAHRRAMLELLAASPAAFSRDHFAPGHFTASCFIVDDAGRLLLHHHRRLDRWLQMGGHVEGDETPVAAARREGIEESGLDDLELSNAILDLDIHRIPAAKGEPDHAHFDIRFLGRTTHPGRIAIDRTESNDLAWVELERAGELLRGEESLRVIGKIEHMMRERTAW
jgi:8-oxo-dGTP pyrophosphatase MutT (NUDIX family)